MITIMTLPKAFTPGLIDTIQRNAFESWKRIRGNVEVLVMGDDPGVAEAAQEYGFRHIPAIQRNEFGTPRVDDLFAKGQQNARFDIVVYVNTDIILPPDFAEYLATAAQHFDQLLMVGQRWDADITERLDFSNPDWLMNLKACVLAEGSLHRQSGIDYFGFKKGLYAQMPPFAIGRTMWDNWLVLDARRRGAAVVDMTDAIFIVHQNHDYNHCQGGYHGAWKGPEAQLNKQMSGLSVGVPGYIQNAATWRMQPTRFVPAAKAELVQASANVEAIWPQTVEQVTSMIEQGKSKEALQVLDSISSVAGNRDDFHYVRGVAFAHSGQTQRAVEACREALRINPGSAPAKQLIEALGGNPETTWASSQSNLQPAGTQPQELRPFE